MRTLEEVKKVISEHKKSQANTSKILGAYTDKTRLQVQGEDLPKLSKEIGINFVVKKRPYSEYPFEISITIDGFKLFGVVTYEYAVKHKLTKKCPVCNKQV